MNTPGNSVSGNSVSIWMADGDRPAIEPLLHDAVIDVCVVGAGVAGLSTALEFARAGRSVIVLDDGVLAGGESERTTAHLTSALDDRYYELERLFGQEGARLAAESHAAAIDRIEANVRDEAIACSFERLDGYLIAPPGTTELLEREHDAARRAGLAVELVARAPLERWDTGACLRFPRQGQLHPMRYFAGLARAILARGARIYGATHVTEVEGGTPARVATARGPTVTAQAVVVATNTPINNRFAIHTKQAAYRTYVIAGGVQRGSVTRALYWDLCERPDRCKPGEPYHYVRLAEDPSSPEHEMLVVGGADHKTGQADDAEARFARLEDWARARFPLADVRFKWSGQVLEPVDALAFIGKNPLDRDNVFIVTGDSGNGMTHGSIAGMLIADLIEGRKSRWAELYDPARKTAAAAADFAAENLDVVRQFVDWVTPSEASDTDGIRPGEGAILRRGLVKVAVHRDLQGRVHELSAVCPHLGCLVAWNSCEKSWDCPCHGSRFSATGEVVINGPANRGLARAAGDAPAPAKARPDRDQPT